METWVQFGILLVAILGGIINTDRRITRLEEDMSAEQKLSNTRGRRLERLESNLK